MYKIIVDKFVAKGVSYGVEDVKLERRNLQNDDE